MRASEWECLLMSVYYNPVSIDFMSVWVHAFTHSDEFITVHSTTHTIHFATLRKQCISRPGLGDCETSTDWRICNKITPTTTFMRTLQCVRFRVDGDGFSSEKVTAKFYSKENIRLSYDRIYTKKKTKINHIFVGWFCLRIWTNQLNWMFKWGPLYVCYSCDGH